MVAWLVVILLVLWMLGFLGPRFSSRIPRTGSLVHILIIIVVILIVLRLLRIA
jgi:hypothetical protein